jgi:hemoglobin-like flavoprotein
MGCTVISKLTDPSSASFLPPKDVALLEGSWPEVEAFGPEKVGAVVFKGLFKTAPETFRMFPAFCNIPKWETDRHFVHHCRTVIALIGSIIFTLKKPELIKRHITTLGFSHAMRDEVPTAEHFRLLGDELLKALEELFGPKWNPALRSAWAKFYNGLSDGIQEEMRQNA